MDIVVCQRTQDSTPKESAGEDDAADAKQMHVQGMAPVGYVFEGGAPTAGAAAEDGTAEILSVSSDNVRARGLG